MHERFCLRSLRSARVSEHDVGLAMTRQRMNAGGARGAAAAESGDDKTLTDAAECAVLAEHLAEFTALSSSSSSRSRCSARRAV